MAGRSTSLNSSQVIYRKEGFPREFSCRYTPHQNSVAERKNRTIDKVARAMLEENHMPKFYWAEAVRTVVYL